MWYNLGMNKILAIFLCCTLIGCTSYQKLTRLKDRGENVSIIEITGNVKDAQKDIQEIASELKLIYLKNTETNNYVQVRHNMVTSCFKTALFSGLAADYDRLGFFFDYNKELNKTKITISEEVLSFNPSHRNEFIDKLKLRDLERQKLISIK